MRDEQPPLPPPPPPPPPPPSGFLGRPNSGIAANGDSLPKLAASAASREEPRPARRRGSSSDDLRRRRRGDRRCCRRRQLLLVVLTTSSLSCLPRLDAFVVVGPNALSSSFSSSSFASVRPCRCPTLLGSRVRRPFSGRPRPPPFHHHCGRLLRAAMEEGDGDGPAAAGDDDGSSSSSSGRLGGGEGIGRDGHGSRGLDDGRDVQKERERKEDPPSATALPQTLRELNKRGIRYAPGATRADLERLLVRGPHDCSSGERETEEADEALWRRRRRRQHQYRRREDGGPQAAVARRDDDDGDGEGRRANKAPATAEVREAAAAAAAEANAAAPPPLSSLLPENDLEHPPPPLSPRPMSVVGASHSDDVTLEAAAAADEDGANASAATAPPPSNDIREMPLAQVLDELQQLGARFSPVSTRAELERMLEEARRKAPTSPPDGTEDGRRRMGADSVDVASSSTRPGDTPAIDSRPTERSNPKRPPRSSQQQPSRTRRRRERDDGDDTQASAAAAAESASAPPPWDAILSVSARSVADWSASTIPHAVDQAYGAARRAVRTVARKAADSWKVDDGGVRDADFTYLYRDEDLYGRVQWLHDQVTGAGSGRNVNGKRMPNNQPVRDRPQQQYRAHAASQRPPSRPSPSSPSSQGTWRPTEAASPDRRARHDSYGRPRSRNTQGSGVPSGTRQYKDRKGTQRPGSRQGVFTRRPFLLPPAGGSLPSTANATASWPETVPPSSSSSTASPSSSRRPSAERKVYSPYGGRDRFDDVGDGLDRFGRFVADVADRFMWGPDDPPRRHGTEESQASSKDGGAERPDAPPESKYRHWKDRLEAQFDTVLGISEDGSYYRRWADRARHDKQTEGGRDPFSVARGVQPKRRGLNSPHHTGNRRYDKPIWEEEGNLVALLFGRTQSGSSLLFDKLLDPNHGSLLFLLRAVLRSLLLVGSYACRWASVRGAFPQPVVVIGVFSALVCAPRNRRMLAVGAALVFFRALGELAHGYAYGNDGWEDDADADGDGSDEEDNE